MAFRGIFFTKSGQILTRDIDKAIDPVVIPINTGDPRLFIKNGELVTPFTPVTFSHVKNVRAAGFYLALYEETSAGEFDPAGMVQVRQRSLEADFAELNPGVE